MIRSSNQIIRESGTVTAAPTQQLSRSRDMDGSTQESGAAPTEELESATKLGDPTKESPPEMTTTDTRAEIDSPKTEPTGETKQQQVAKQKKLSASKKAPNIAGLPAVVKKYWWAFALVVTVYLYNQK